jgi:hypothetical protein
MKIGVYQNKRRGLETGKLAFFTDFMNIILCKKTGSFFEEG